SPGPAEPSLSPARYTRSPILRDYRLACRQVVHLEPLLTGHRQTDPPYRLRAVLHPYSADRQWQPAALQRALAPHRRNPEYERDPQVCAAWQAPAPVAMPHWGEWGPSPSEHRCRCLARQVAHRASPWSPATIPAG